MRLIPNKLRCLISFLVSALPLRLCQAIEIRVPVNYTALTGDLEIHVQNLMPQDDAYYLQLLEYYPSDNSYTIIGSTPLWRDNTSSTSNVYKARFACGLIAQGGRYGVRIQFNVDTNVNEVLLTIPDDEDEPHVEQDQQKNYIIQLDVRWPPVSLYIEPSEIETYPETSITASVAFPKSYCEPSIGSLVPENWISLIYCGHSQIDCKLENISHTSQILYSEQIRGYPSLRYIQLNCNLFGQAGYYTLFLTSGIHGTGTIVAKLPVANILHAKWSEKFVFNVHTRSIFQCDAHGGGVAVLFQYPDCILPNDKIRLFGSLRADVASSLPPTSLHYITEQKVIKGKYSLHFDCDLFTEKYVEYCFVYVNQAITGAVSDVRMDCVPTFPVTDKDAGQWSNWSEWSECSSTCKGGIRTKYRFCDSPSPKYGAKYCEGHTVETEQCGNSTSWECQLYDAKLAPESLTEKPSIEEVASENCRCGCNLHLTIKNPQRFLAVSLRDCLHKASWKIQADREHTIQLYMNRVHFPCVTQKLKLHDGEHPSANLLAQFTSNDDAFIKNFSVMSSTSVLLLEYSISDTFDNSECVGGFFCHFRQKAVNMSHINHIHAESMSAEMPVDAVHLAILVMLAIVVSMSICMMIQYVNRYHKYQRTSINDEADSEYSENCSRQNFAAVISHETSTSTLISEIIPLRKIYDKECGNSEESQRSIEDGSHQSEITSHSDNDEESTRKEESAKEKVKKKYIKGEHPRLKIFKAEVHTENKADNSQGYKSPNSSTKDAMESISSPSLNKSNESHTPSSCTNMSVSSSVSPTLSSRTNPERSLNSSLRGLTLKRVKDIRNQERMMVGSDFSLTGHDLDLEMDYYDYNVHNTNTVPGSYLGMDPAYCVWIPPYAPGQWMDNGSDEEDSSMGNDIEMRVFDGKQNNDNSRSETPYSEKFQKECKPKEKEQFKRFSNTSMSSSSNRTIIQEDITSDDEMSIRDTILSDSHQCYVKDLDKVVEIPLLEKDLKFADEEEDDLEVSPILKSNMKRENCRTDYTSGGVTNNETSC